MIFEKRLSFTRGDKVRIRPSYYDENYSGKIGTVVTFIQSIMLFPERCKVKFEETGTTRYFLASDLEFVTFENGDKIAIPKTKSSGCDMEDSEVVKQVKKLNQDFLYFSEYEGFHKVSLDVDKNTNGGDYFTISEITPYVEKVVTNKPVSRPIIIKDDRVEILEGFLKGAKGVCDSIDKLHNKIHIKIENIVIIIPLSSVKKIEKPKRNEIKFKYINGEKIKVTYTDKNTYVKLPSGEEGKASCLKEDIFIDEVGFKIAYSRANIKKYTKLLNETIENTCKPSKNIIKHKVNCCVPF